MNPQTKYLIQEEITRLELQIKHLEQSIKEGEEALKYPKADLHDKRLTLVALTVDLGEPK